MTRLSRSSRIAAALAAIIVFAGLAIIGSSRAEASDWGRWEYTHGGSLVMWRAKTWSNPYAESGCYTTVQLRNDNPYIGARFRAAVTTLEGKELDAAEGLRITLDPYETYTTWNLDSCGIAGVTLRDLTSY